MLYNFFNSTLKNIFIDINLLIINMNLEYFKVSEEHEKMVEQLKYLISLDPKLIKEELLHFLNKLQPFIEFPLDNPPPIELFQVDSQNSKIVTEDLKTELASYCFIIMRGSMVISRQSYQFSEQKYLDEENIKQKSVYNFNEGKSRMTALKNSVYLKIHNIWIKKAKKKQKEREQEYIQNKLIDIDFFSRLAFQEFNQCCKKAYIKRLGPDQILIKENQVPYHMYIVSEGELCLETKVKFSKQEKVWNQVKSLIKNNYQFCQELYDYLVREPNQSDQIFEINFSLKQIHQGQIIGARQTLLEQPLPYTIRSTLATKVICIKYPDLYVLQQEKLTQIRNWPYLCEIDKLQLRGQYYSLMSWNDFKEFLKEESKLVKVQRKKFDEYLRKDVDLNAKRYKYCPQKVGQGKIVQSPAGKVLKIKDLSQLPNKQINFSKISNQQY